MRLLLDAEQFCIYYIKSQNALSKINYDTKLSFECVVHFLDNAELNESKCEFTSIHISCKTTERAHYFVS